MRDVDGNRLAPLTRYTDLKDLIAEPIGFPERGVLCSSSELNELFLV